MRSSGSVEDIHRTLAELAERGRRCLLAVVLAADGSTPCKAGAKAVMDAEGVLQGTIGGGWVEAETQRRAAETIQTGRPIVLDFGLEGRAIEDTGAICGGVMRVLIDPTAVRHLDAYSAAAALRCDRRRGVLLTTIRGRAEPDVAVECFVEEAIPAGLGFADAEEMRRSLQHEQARLFTAEEAAEGQPREVFVEPLVPRPVLLVVGGGHVGQAVAVQADLVGSDVVVIDDRPEFTRAELFPAGATMRCGDVAEEVAGFPVDADTYIVIATRSHQHDAKALAACLHGPAAYIGMIGSRRKVAMVRKDFVASGRATAAEFDRIYAPVGLDLGGVTVPEIAASIVAQLIAVRRKGASPRISPP